MMAGWPKLVGIEETGFGSWLHLSDGHQVPIDVRPQRIAEALIEQRIRPLSELLAERSTDVTYDEFRPTREEWTRICEIVLDSRKAKRVLGRHARIWNCFSEPYDVVRDKPHNLFCAREETFFTYHALLFRPDDSRQGQWLRARLRALRGRHFELWAEMQTGAVAIRPSVSFQYELEEYRPGWWAHAISQLPGWIATRLV